MSSHITAPTPMGLSIVTKVVLNMRLLDAGQSAARNLAGIFIADIVL
jgi:hypothetical protein